MHLPFLDPPRKYDQAPPRNYDQAPPVLCSSDLIGTKVLEWPRVRVHFQFHRGCKFARPPAPSKGNLKLAKFWNMGWGEGGKALQRFSLPSSGVSLLNLHPRRCPSAVPFTTVKRCVSFQSTSTIRRKQTIGNGWCWQRLAKLT